MTGGPHGAPGNGGSNCTIVSPAATRARAVRLQARKVRLLAWVKRASGSVPSADFAARYRVLAMPCVPHPALRPGRRSAGFSAVSHGVQRGPEPGRGFVSDWLEG